MQICNDGNGRQLYPGAAPHTTGGAQGVTQAWLLVLVSTAAPKAFQIGAASAGFGGSMAAAQQAMPPEPLFAENQRAVGTEQRTCGFGLANTGGAGVASVVERVWAGLRQAVAYISVAS